MSEIPSLEQMLKLWSKKDLWNRIQEKNKRIAELEEQLKNAIVPKFKIGQEVYVVRNNKILREKIANIGIWQVSNTYDMQLDWEYRTEQCMAVYIEEKDVFATKEEAQAKLEELKGEKK
jgi:hypothetical protein